MSTHVIPSLAGLSINDPTEPSAEYPNCYPTINPVDQYRIHVSELIAKALNLDAKNVYPRVQWTNTLDKGDLVLAVCLQSRGFSDCWLANDGANDVCIADCIGPLSSNQGQEAPGNHPAARRQLPRV